MRILTNVNFKVIPKDRLNMLANFRLLVLRTVLQATLFHCNLSDCTERCREGLMHFMLYLRREI